MKKLLVYGLIVALTAVLFGCSNSSGNSTGKNEGGINNTQSSNPVKLQLSIWGDDNKKKFIEGVIKKFTDDHPNIQVEVLLIPFSDYQQKVSIMTASQTAPDIIALFDRAIPQFIKADELMDISSLKNDSEYDYADLFSTSLEIYSRGDQLYGIPYTNPPTVLFYNKTLFEEKGMKTPLELYAEGKWTYDEFYKTAKALTDPKQGIYGARLMTPDWKNWSGSLMGLLWSYGADIFNEDGTKFVLNSKEGEQAIQLFYDLIFKDNIHIKPGDQLSFETGKIAMSNQDYNYVNNAMNIKDFEWDIAPKPTGPQADAPTPVGLGGYSVWKDTKHPEEALEFIKFLTSKEASQLQTNLFMPNRKSILMSDEFLNGRSMPSAAGIQAALIDKMDSGVRVLGSHENWQQIDVKIQTTLDLLYTQNKTVKEVLELMEKEVAPLVK
jgi:multiple sugar transport system substrate-binding protein